MQQIIDAADNGLGELVKQLNITQACLKIDSTAEIFKWTTLSDLEDYEFELKIKILQILEGT